MVLIDITGRPGASGIWDTGSQMGEGENTSKLNQHLNRIKCNSTEKKNPASHRGVVRKGKSC